MSRRRQRSVDLISDSGGLSPAYSVDEDSDHSAIPPLRPPPRRRARVLSTCERCGVALDRDTVWIMSHIGLGATTCDACAPLPGLRCMGCDVLLPPVLDSGHYAAWCLRCSHASDDDDDNDEEESDDSSASTPSGAVAGE